MDKILIEEIEVNAIIGTLPEERLTPQKVIISAELGGDFRAAGRSDDFTLTFDYSEAERRIVDFTAASSYQLLEALAEHLAAHLLELDHLESVRLRILKPGAARFARGISIDIERRKTLKNQ